MKTVLMITPNAMDGVSLYRHWGPMHAIEKLGLVKPITLPDDPGSITHWGFYKKAHFAFFHRPSRIFDKAIAEECVKHQLPYWVDLDDNIFMIPDDNDSHSYYTDSAIKICIEVLKRAAVITVATKPLQEFLKNHFSLKSEVIPNGLDDCWVKLRNKFDPEKQKALFRGSRAVMADVLYYQGAIENLMHKTALDFEFFGLNPYFIQRRFKEKRIEYFAPRNFVDYMWALKHHKSRFCFVPQLSSEFHKTKSVNAWLEATWAGLPVMGPDHGQWNHVGWSGEGTCLLYKPMDVESFVAQFMVMTELSNKDANAMVEQSWETIEKNYLLSEINLKRIEIIKKLSP